MKVSTDACLMGALVPVEHSQNILDIGAGTGLLSLMAAQRSLARIDAVELDPDAARQARENFTASPWQDRLHVEQCSIQEFAGQTSKQYDTILCNPPFFTRHLASPNSQRHQARHNDSLPFRELAEIAARLLTPEGRFIVLLPVTETRGFIQICATLGLHCQQTINIKPTPDKEPNRKVLSFSLHNIDSSHPENNQMTHKEHTILIHEGQGYSEEFQKLLRPYYLSL